MLEVEAVIRVAGVIFICVLSAVPAMAEPAKPKIFSIVGATDMIPQNQLRLPTSAKAETAMGEPTRAEVSLITSLEPGTILVKTAERKLYFIEPNRRAISWSVAVGRQGYSWRGTNSVSRKAEWPDWRPPPEMLQREAASGHIIPDFVKGGPGNPLGSRALYLGDSAYRIHGTDKPWSIGQASSSGCIRMMNADIEELYQLTKIGTRVVVE